MTFESSFMMAAELAATDSISVSSVVIGKMGWTSYKFWMLTAFPVTPERQERKRT